MVVIISVVGHKYVKDILKGIQVWKELHDVSFEEFIEMLYFLGAWDVDVNGEYTEGMHITWCVNCINEEELW
jgi:hypothetical protein